MVEDHGMVGNLQSVALPSRYGAINFMCFPNFDSPPVFCSLLDPEHGGSFEIKPCCEGFAFQQLYLPDTAVLLTRFLHADGIAELTDFMPVDAESSLPHCLVRKVRCVRGTARLHVSCRPSFDFGRAPHKVNLDSDGAVFCPSDRGLTALRLQLPVEAEIGTHGDVNCTLSMRAGECATFVLGAADEHPLLDAETAFDRTVQYWRTWSLRCRYQGRWREMVHRSAVTLKLMTSAKHGSIVAAPTLGLPEAPGGRRNWDYRFTWIRDASLCMREFLELGHTEEVGSFAGWLESRIQAWSAEEGLRPVFQLNGEAVPEEQSVDLRGYLDSRPVRIGNAADAQLQLDVGGPLFDALWRYAQQGGTLSHDFWKELSRLATWFSNNWQRPDEGVWEVRGEAQHFLHSRVMCWTALDRAWRIANLRALPCPREKWLEERDRIYEAVHQDFWCAERRAFVQRLGSTQLDAAAFLMPQMEFCGGTDPRWLQTMEAIEENLAEDALVWRYRQLHTGSDPDPLTTDEGSFTVCSFWLVESLARAGRLKQAQLYFDKMLGYANHLGLYAEQLGHRGEHLGNFPQAFTHLGLITAAIELDLRLNQSGGVY